MDKLIELGAHSLLMANGMIMMRTAMVAVIVAGKVIQAWAMN